jgi:hypothetical protein
MDPYFYQPFAFQYGGMNTFRGAKYQYGGMHVFRGAKYQYGDGLGDVLRGIGRFLLPIVGRVAHSFLGNFNSNISQGQSLKDAAVGSIKPTLDATVEEAKGAFNKRMQQGSGHGSSKPKYQRLKSSNSEEEMAKALYTLHRRNAVRRGKVSKGKSKGKAKSESKPLIGRGKRRKVAKRKRSTSRKRTTSRRKSSKRRRVISNF